MNAIAEIFVKAYENNEKVTPVELLSAGWTYKQLAIFMQCCNVLRAISIYHLESQQHQHKEKVEPCSLSLLDSVSKRLSALIGEEIRWNLLSCSFLGFSYNGHLNVVTNSYILELSATCCSDNDTEWLSKLFIDGIESIQTICSLIGQYLSTGIMVECGHANTSKPIHKFTVNEAQIKKVELEIKLTELKNKQLRIDSNEPNFYNDDLLDFSDIYKWSKQIGEYISNRDDIEDEIYTVEDEIAELEVYLKDPQRYIQEHRFSELCLKTSQVSWMLRLNDSTLNPPSALMSIGLKDENKFQEIFIVNDVQDRSEKNIWVNRGFSKAIFSTLIQGKSELSYKGTDYIIEEVTIFNEKAMDILCNDVFRNPDEIKTIYIYSHKHIDNIEKNYEAVTAFVMCANSDIPVPFNIYHDSKEDRYFINGASYSEYSARYGLPMMKLKAYVPRGSVFSMNNLSEMSVLRLYGYTVNENDGLTEGERHELLKNLMDSKLMSKTDILNHIEWLINTHEKSAQYMTACDKWKADLQFVNTYKIDSQRTIWGRFALRQKA